MVNYNPTFISNAITNGFAVNTEGQMYNFDELIAADNFKNSDQLYDIAHKILKNSISTLNKKDNVQAMERVVRAYAIIQDPTIKSSPLNKERPEWKKTLARFWFGDIRDRINKINESIKIFKSHFETYLKAKHNIRSNNIHEVDLLERLHTHSHRVEVMLKELGVSKKEWDTFKQEVTDTNLNQANAHWNTFLNSVKRLSNPRFKNIKKVEKFLLGDLPLLNFVKPADAFEARCFSQISTLESIFSNNPKYNDEWLKAQTYLIRGNHKKFHDKLKSLVSKTGKRDLYKILFNPYTAPKRRRNYVSPLEGKNTQEEIKEALTQNNLFNKTVTAARNNKLKIPKSPGTDISGVTLNNKAYLAGAAPRENNVDAYFDTLEINDTRIIVDLKNDFEPSMNQFHLLPIGLGQKVKHGNTEITLTSQHNTEIESPNEYLQNVTISTILVNRNGKKTSYQHIQLNHLPKDAAPSVDVLKDIHRQINEAKNAEFGTRFIVQCDDGKARTSTFLLSYHLAETNSNETPTNPLDLYVQYRQYRSATKNVDQFAAAIAGAKEIIPNNNGELSDNDMRPDDDFILGDSAEILFDRNEQFDSFKERIADHLIENAPSLYLLKTDEEWRKVITNKISEFFEHQLRNVETQRIFERLQYLSSDDLDFIAKIAILHRDYSNVTDNLLRSLNITGGHFLDIFSSNRREALYTALPADFTNTDIEQFLLNSLHQNLPHELKNDLTKVKRHIQQVKNSENLTTSEASKLHRHLEDAKKNFMTKHFAEEAFANSVRELELEDLKIFDLNILEFITPVTAPHMPIEFFKDLTSEQLQALTSKHLDNLTVEQLLEITSKEKLKDLNPRVVTAKLLMKVGDDRAEKILKKHPISKEEAERFIKKHMKRNPPADGEKQILYYDLHRYALLSIRKQELDQIHNLCNAAFTEELPANLKSEVAFRKLFIASRACFREIKYLYRLKIGESLVYPPGNLLSKELEATPREKPFLAVLGDIDALIRTIGKRKIKPTEAEIEDLIELIQKIEEFNKDIQGLDPSTLSNRLATLVYTKLGYDIPGVLEHPRRG